VDCYLLFRRYLIKEVVVAFFLEYTQFTYTVVFLRVSGLYGLWFLSSRRISVFNERC